MHTHLPTCTFESWTVTSLRDSLLAELRKDKSSKVLKMFFYAITRRGWMEIHKAVKQWEGFSRHRAVIVYVGTDHAITEPVALEMMQGDKVEVRLMKTYQGVFHPKVVWLEGKDNNVVWVASNNLTRDGLLYNIEFAVVVKSRDIPAELEKWADAVKLGSEILTPDLLQSYKTERQKFEGNRAKAKATTFTWSRKREPARKKRPDVTAGNLIVEIMPKETGLDGTQIQLPLAAAKTFFGLKKGVSKTIILSPKGSEESRPLKMTIFGNNTVRLSIFDLEYRDRPCVIVFQKLEDARTCFEIVAQNIFPTRYKALLALCTKKTRKGSRRWAII